MYYDIAYCVEKKKPGASQKKSLSFSSISVFCAKKNIALSIIKKNTTC